MSATTGSAAPGLTAAVSWGSRTVSPPSTASFASRAPPTAARSSPPPSPSATRPRTCEARPAPRQRSKTRLHVLVAKPVVLAATGGTARHALVIDDQMRPLFAYLRALALPPSVYAAPEDWGASELGDRIERAATELAVVLRAGVEQHATLRE